MPGFEGGTALMTARRLISNNLPRYCRRTARRREHQTSSPCCSKEDLWCPFAYGLTERQESAGLIRPAPLRSAAYCRLRGTAGCVWYIRILPA